MENPSLVLSAPKALRIEDRPVPVISDPHDVLIRVASTGICGSDMHYYRHGKIDVHEVKAPMVLGHESAGIVVEIGQAVTTLRIGDRVALEPGVPCRLCAICARGTYNLCRRMRFAATPPYDGTLCDIFRLTEDFCHKIPSHLSFDEGAMAEPLSVAVHSVRTQAAVQVGDTVVVFGAGPIGLLCCAVARALGAAQVVAVDVNSSRLEFAKGYAATDICNATHLPKDSFQAAEALLTGVGLGTGGCDVAIDASGVETSIQIGIHCLRPGGTFVQAGMGCDNVSFPIGTVAGKELHVKGTFRYGPGDYETAIHLMATGKVDAAGLITTIVPFSQAEDVFRGAGSVQGIKTIIRGPAFTREEL